MKLGDFTWQQEIRAISAPDQWRHVEGPRAHRIRMAQWPEVSKRINSQGHAALGGKRFKTFSSRLSLRHAIATVIGRVRSFKERSVNVKTQRCLSNQGLLRRCTERAR